MSDENLVKSIKSGDNKAFEKMYSIYAPKLQNFLTRMCNNPLLAEDMLQETLLKVHKNIKSFKGKSKFSTWLFQIAANNCKMFKRKPFNKEEPISNHHEKILSGNITEKIENKSLIQDYLMKIPPIYRAAVILSDLENFTSKEIAKIFNITQQNAKMRILRGRKMLFDLAKNQESRQKNVKA